MAGAAGAAGLVILGLRRRPDGLAVVLVASALAAAPLLAFGDVRFKVPVVPFLAVGVGVGVTLRRRLGSSGAGLGSRRGRVAPAPPAAVPATLRPVEPATAPSDRA